MHHDLTVMLTVPL